MWHQMVLLEPPLSFLSTKISSKHFSLRKQIWALWWYWGRLCLFYQQQTSNEYFLDEQEEVFEKLRPIRVFFCSLSLIRGQIEVKLISWFLWTFHSHKENDFNTKWKAFNLRALESPIASMQGRSGIQVLVPDIPRYPHHPLLCS